MPEIDEGELTYKERYGIDVGSRVVCVRGREENPRIIDGCVYTIAEVDARHSGDVFVSVVEGSCRTLMYIDRFKPVKEG